MLTFGKSYKSILIFTIITVFLFTLPAFAEVCYPGGTESKEITNPITPIVGAKINCDWDENGVGFCRVVDYQLEVCEKTNNNFIGEVVSIDFVSQNENGVTLADLYEKCDRSPAQTSWCSGIFHEEWSGENEYFAFKVPREKRVAIHGGAWVYENDVCEGKHKDVIGKIKITAYYKYCCPDGYTLDYKNEQYICKPEKPCQGLSYDKCKEMEDKGWCHWCGSSESGYCMDEKKWKENGCDCSKLKNKNACEAVDGCTWYTSFGGFCTKGSCPTCFDEDGGKIREVASYCEDKKGMHKDKCVGNNVVMEWYCENGECKSEKIQCKSDEFCLNGRCAGCEDFGDEKFARVNLRVSGVERR